MPCNKIDKSLLIYRVVTKPTNDYYNVAEKMVNLVVFMPKNVFLSNLNSMWWIESTIHDHVYWIHWNRCEIRIECLASLIFYLFSSTCLINSTKHEHSYKVIYSIVTWAHDNLYLMFETGLFHFGPKHTYRKTCVKTATQK